ncbi:hypothetical protein GGS20DRAFT_538678 [Poronia punctata]|nr:hypothetical protein GGS20DRAFT_538678 [Poronia punctata]
MDQCANALLAFPPQDDSLNTNETYNEAALVHVQQLGLFIKDRSKELVGFSTSLLNILDPAIHSLSYLAVLHQLVVPHLATSVPQAFVLEKLVTFLMKFDGRQCRYAGSMLLDILNAVGSRTLLPPSVAVETLSSALLKLDPSATMFTHLHHTLVVLAYTTDVMNPALPVIDSDIVYFPGMANQETGQYLCDLKLPPYAYISRSTGLADNVTSSMVLEYDFLCGMIYCTKRDWEKARVAFGRVVTYPVKEAGCSKIMVDAYKKWALVSLLSTGSFANASPFITTSTHKIFNTLGNHYTALAATFASDDVEKLLVEASQHAHIWQEDGNASLVEEVLATYQKWRVLSLRDIYTKLSIAEIRKATKSGETGQALPTDEDVEALIQTMIIGGMLNGVIEKNDDGTKFLTFLPSVVYQPEAEFDEECARIMERLKGVGAVIAATNQRLGTSKDYIKWSIRESRRDKSGEAHDAVPEFESHIDDEDLMGGVMATG